MEDVPSTFSQASGAVDWTWTPFTAFNTKFRKVTHIFAELDDDGGSGDPVIVDWVGPDLTIRIGTLDLNSRRFRTLEFDTPLILREGESLRLAFDNDNDRAVKLKVFSHV